MSALPPFALEEHALADFLQLLRAEGFRFGLSEITRALTLLRILQLDGRAPGSPEQLAAVIAPAVCSSAEEQQQMGPLLSAWLASRTHARNTGPDSLPQLERLGSERAPSSQERRFGHLARGWVLVTAVGLLVLGAAPAAWWLGLLAAPAALSSSGGSSISSSSSTSSTSSISSSSRSESSHGPVTTQVTAPQKVIRRMPYYALPPLPAALPWPLRLALAAAPLLLCSALLGLAAGLLRRGVWRRYGLRPVAQLSLLFPFRQQQLFGAPGLQPQLQRLRRGTERPSSLIDFPATVQETAKAAGFPTIRHAGQRRPIGYLLLFDSHSRADHQSLAVTQLMERLQDAQVDLTSFEYASTPASLRPWKADRQKGQKPPAPRSLAEVLREHPRHVVLIAGGPASLRQADAYELNPALAGLLEHPQRMLLTGSAGSLAEGDREFLDRNGFQVLDCSSEGLADLVRRMVEPQEEGGPARSAAPPIPPSLAVGTARWLQPLPPRASAVRTLTDELRICLGPEGCLYSNVSG